MRREATNKQYIFKISVVSEDKASAEKILSAKDHEKQKECGRCIDNFNRQAWQDSMQDVLISAIEAKVGYYATRTYIVNNKHGIFWGLCKHTLIYFIFRLIMLDGEQSDDTAWTLRVYVSVHEYNS